MARARISRSDRSSNLRMDGVPRIPAWSVAFDAGPTRHHALERPVACAWLLSNLAVLGLGHHSGQDARPNGQARGPSVAIALRRSLADLAQVALEKIIEEGADSGDRRESRHLVRLW
jgi:hypothetical protein